MEWFYSYEMDCWVFFFELSKKKAVISRQFICDFKGTMDDLVQYISSTYKLTGAEQECIYRILINQHKKVIYAKMYGGNLSIEVIPVRDRPEKIVLHLVDLGEGMLVPKAFVEDFISWMKPNDSEEWWPDNETYQFLLEKAASEYTPQPKQLWIQKAIQTLSKYPF